MIYKQALAAALSIALLTLMSASAPGNRLLFRNSLGTREWEATWSSFEFSFFATGSTCALTLRGSLHSSTITKTRSLLVGYVTNASTGGCGPFLAATVLTANLPWHVRYQSFAGALPRIERVGLQIIGFEYRMRENGINIACLYRSTAEAPLNMDWLLTSTGAVRSAELSGELLSECRIVEHERVISTPSSFSPSASITLI